MIVLSGANLLILDEPTNHLDVESIEALEDAVDDYEGTVILVSHDRELLRTLTTKVWILHDRHITEFDGNFAEWEAVSAERAHAASVRAAEDRALLRVKERQRVAPQSGRDRERDAQKTSRREGRVAARELELAEQRVAELEARIAKLSVALEDPELYTRPNGIAESARLGVELDAVRAELDVALERWGAASEAVQGAG